MGSKPHLLKVQTDAMPASASSRKRCRHLFNLLRNAAPQTRRGNDFPAGIAVSPAFFV
jgi:hypothetical protein